MNCVIMHIKLSQQCSVTSTRLISYPVCTVFKLYQVKGGSVRYDVLCITSTYGHKANVSHPLHRVDSLCLECNVLLTYYSTKF